MMLLKLLSGQDGGGGGHLVVALGPDGAVTDRIRSMGAAVHSLGMAGGRPPSPAAVRRLFKLSRDYRPQVIQGWMYHGNLMASLVGCLAPGRPPVIWNIRQALYDIGREKRMTVLIMRLGARMSLLPGRIIYNSRAGAEQHEKMGYARGRTLIIPNGFDCGRFRPSPEARALVRRRLGVPDDALLIGLIARYHPVKDHANFFAAAAKLASRRSDAHFALAGAMVDEGNRELAGMIDNAGLRRRVHLMGEQANMPEIDAALDVATSSSVSEGFPNVIGEAMACGVPCVVTDVGDSALIVGDTGKVVPPKNSDALAAGWAAISDMGPERRKALGGAARRRIVERYSLQDVVARYVQLYSDTALERRPVPAEAGYGNQKQSPGRR
ncbi:MAG: glycosyltransferase [Nitrospiraceae bacterium]|nr:glycosyltransferase [Nitrospiraceae bacterium]